MSDDDLSDKTTGDATGTSLAVFSDSQENKGKELFIVEKQRLLTIASTFRNFDNINNE